MQIKRLEKIIVPPIKCQGIKTKLVTWIAEHAEFNDSGRWIEPFMGSGVVGFNVRPKRAVFADINKHIIDFYNAIKKKEITPPIAKAYLIEQGRYLEEKGAEHYYLIREKFNEKGEPLDLLFLSRSCFNGMIRFNRRGKYNVPFGHKPKRFSKAYITKITNQINNVSVLIYNNDWEFHSFDFRESIKKAGEKDFVYCDPPYMGRHVDYYNSWSEKDEIDLRDVLQSIKAKFILSTWSGNQYRKNKMLDALWGEFMKAKREHFYHVGAREKNRNSIEEAIVMNYWPEIKEKEKVFATQERLSLVSSSA